MSSPRINPRAQTGGGILIIPPPPNGKWKWKIFSGKSKRMFVHARFTEPLKPWFTSWVSTNSPRYIIAEEVGVKNEGLHYHTCFETSLGLDSIKKKFCQAAKDQGLQVAKGKANAYYGAVKECTDASYIVKEDKIILHHGYLEQTLKDLVQEGKQKFRRQLAPIVASPVAHTATIVKVKKSRPMREKFIDYLLKERKWKAGQQFSMDHDDPIRYFNRIETEVIDAATEYWEAAFTIPEGIRMVKHALWVFSCEETRECIKIKNSGGIRKNLWS